MAQAAFAAASFIQQQPGYAALPLHPSLAEMTPATGLATTDDLVIALDSPRILSRYPAQTVPLIRLLSAAKKEPLPSDPSSLVTLLGGESVRLYDDPSLGHPAERPYDRDSEQRRHDGQADGQQFRCEGERVRAGLRDGAEEQNRGQHGGRRDDIAAAAHRYEGDQQRTDGRGRGRVDLRPVRST